MNIQEGSCPLQEAYLNTFVVVFHAVPELSLHALLQQTLDILVHAKLGVVLHTLLCAGGFGGGGCLQCTTGTVMKVHFSPAFSQRNGQASAPFMTGTQYRTS